jgi:hypothetical protein
MCKLDVGQGSWGGLPPFDGVVEARDEQAVFNGIQTLGAFWMALAHFMKPTICVCEIAGSTHK